MPRAPPGRACGRRFLAVRVLPSQVITWRREVVITHATNEPVRAPCRRPRPRPPSSFAVDLPLSHAPSPASPSSPSRPEQVQNLLSQMQSRFQQMSDSIITRIDEMGERIDDLEKSVGDLIQQADEEGGNEKAVAEK